MTTQKQQIFPRTRYQGSKYKLREWIKHDLKDLDFKTALDAFSGTSSISYVMKELGKEVYSNDIMECNYQVSKALVENSQVRISEEDYQEILVKKDNYDYLNIIEKNFHDIYYTDEENRWLDIVVQNIHQIKCEYKKAIFFWALFQACISKRPYNLFHRKNLYVRTSDVKRSFGNKKTWDTPFEKHFSKFIKEINNSIFDNGKNNKSYCKDIFELDVEVDLVYIDTPYIPQKGTLTIYSEFYHFLNGISFYFDWEKHIDYKSKHKRLLPKYSIWDDKKNVLAAFEKLINKFQRSILVISYREDGIPSIEELVEILKKYGKTVKIKTVNYKYVLSKKQNLKEVLIVAE